MKTKKDQEETRLGKRKEELDETKRREKDSKTEPGEKTITTQRGYDTRKSSEIKSEMKLKDNVKIVFEPSIESVRPPPPPPQ